MLFGFTEDDILLTPQTTGFLSLQALIFCAKKAFDFPNATATTPSKVEADWGRACLGRDSNLCPHSRVQN